MAMTVWSSEPFLAEVTGWVRREAGDAGLQLTGEWEQPHVAPWSSTVRFGTQDGGIWFKVNGAGTVAALAPEAGGLTEDQQARLVSVLPELESWCAELAASGIPTTVNHDDLHSSNVCVGPSGARIIDWGDTGLSHPFTTMLATLNSIAWHSGLARDDARVLRMRDAYLEPFSGFADRADLHRWVALARRVGCVGKAVSYAQAFVGAPPAAEAEEDWPVRGWLLELLDPGP